MGEGDLPKALDQVNGKFLVRYELGKHPALDPELLLQQSTELRKSGLEADRTLSPHMLIFRSTDLLHRRAYRLTINSLTQTWFSYANGGLALLLLNLALLLFLLCLSLKWDQTDSPPLDLLCSRSAHSRLSSSNNHITLSWGLRQLYLSLPPKSVGPTTTRGYNTRTNEISLSLFGAKNRSARPM
ncbi:hypothetical protein VNO77_47745 [Canavalia gladiata]|uniref:Uncharacterized protein n=1 Tax=Canavalia gladiata TaxID=3824 RepID=A0AAN9JES8_CANGL